MQNRATRSINYTPASPIDLAVRTRVQHEKVKNRTRAEIKHDDEAPAIHNASIR